MAKQFFFNNSKVRHIACVQYNNYLLKRLTGQISTFSVDKMSNCDTETTFQC